MDKSMMVYRQNPEFVCWDNIELMNVMVDLSAMIGKLQPPTLF